MTVKQNNEVKDFLSELKELITINSNLEADDTFFNNIKEVKQNNNELTISFDDGTVIQINAK